MQAQAFDLTSWFYTLRIIHIMAYRSSTTAIPLPFATAGIGLCLSYVFKSHLNAPIATVSGFLFGILALYLSGRSAAYNPSLL
jgi:hypothetical protein